MKIYNFFETFNIFNHLNKIFERNVSFREDIYGNHLKKVLNQIEAGEASSKPSARGKETSIPTDSSKKVLKT